MKIFTCTLFTILFVFSYSSYSQCFTELSSGSYSVIGKKVDGTFGDGDQTPMDS